MYLFPMMTLINIFLTSGTTGRPKGATRTHGHDMINMMSCAIELGLTRDDRALLLFPFYHITFTDNLRHILMANTIVIRREGSFVPEEVLDLLSTEGITTCQFVPTTVNAMLQVESLDKYDLSRFRLLIYAASPMPVELLKKSHEEVQVSILSIVWSDRNRTCHYRAQAGRSCARRIRGSIGKAGFSRKASCGL